MTIRITNTHSITSLWQGDEPLHSLTYRGQTNNLTSFEFWVNLMLKFRLSKREADFFKEESVGKRIDY